MPIIVIYVCAGLLIIAVAPLPYGYYTFLRLVACGTFGFAAAIAYLKRYSVLPWIYGSLAILFNPFAPIFLTRDIWFFIDIGAATFLLFSSKNIAEEEPKNAVINAPLDSPKESISGSDYQHAIPVSTVEQEYEWIQSNFPNAKRTNQEVHSTKEGLVDVLDIELSDGTTRKLYFNITGILLKYVSNQRESK